MPETERSKDEPRQAREAGARRAKRALGLTDDGPPRSGARRWCRYRTLRPSDLCDSGATLLKRRGGRLVDRAPAGPGRGEGEGDVPPGEGARLQPAEAGDHPRVAVAA